MARRWDAHAQSQNKPSLLVQRSIAHPVAKHVTNTTVDHRRAASGRPGDLGPLRFRNLSSSPSPCLDKPSTARPRSPAMTAARPTIDKTIAGRRVKPSAPFQKSQIPLCSRQPPFGRVSAYHCRVFMSMLPGFHWPELESISLATFRIGRRPMGHHHQGPRGGYLGMCDGRARRR